MENKIKSLFENRKVLILGMGREGQSTANFLKKFCPDFQFVTADQKDGENYLENIKDFDLIIKSPGISWNIKEIKWAREAGMKFISQTQIFLDLFADKTIGVTGTKGKSTTASLIYNILKTANKKVQLVGNIGKPVLDYVDEKIDWFVFEMSSHQLSDVTRSPHVAIFLNIYPEHLDYYGSFEEYFKAKANIALYQSTSDIFIYNNDFDEISDLAASIKSTKYPFSSQDKLSDLGINLENNPLMGEHNLNNIIAAILTAQSLNINNEHIQKGIESFEPLEDRLEKVREVAGVTFINDGLATIPQATISAIKSFEDKNITLILGGFDRGVDFSILGKFLSGNRDVKSIVLIGQTANKIANTLKENNFMNDVINLGMVSMKEIVKAAYELASSPGVVLFSPSATSFDMFKDYKDRDEQFKKAVNSLE